MKINYRLDWVDGAKAVGIWLVVVGHLLSGGDEAGIVEIIIWTFHMPLFFYLSGLTAKTTNSINYVNDFKKSIRSIAVPYLVFSLISIALYSLENSINLLVLGKQLLEMLYGVSGKDRWMSYNVPLWFFTCLFCVRVIFLGLSVWLKKSSDIFGVTLILAITAHVLFVFSIPRLPWNIDVALCALVFYSAGYAWGNRAFLSDSTPWIVRLVFCLFFAVVVYSVSISNGRVDMNGRYFNNPVLFYIGAFSGIIVVAFIAQSISKFHWLTTVGVASVVIFPMHGLLHYFLPGRTFSILNWYTYRVTGSTTVSAMVFGAFEVALCMPFFWVFIRYAPLLIGRARISGSYST
jgi:acyltransferase